MTQCFDDLPVYEIWFDLYEIERPLLVRVQGINSARETWDRLNREFEMISARP